MRNPWTKKNPFLSLWLSGFNATAGAARGHAAAAAKRQSATFVATAAEQTRRYWNAVLTPPKPRSRKPR